MIQTNDDHLRRSRFAVAASRSGPAAVLRLSGDLDHDTAKDLEAALDAASVGSTRILLDCSGLEFCDSRGLNILLRARRTAAETGTELALIGPRGALARVLEITGMDNVINRYPSLDQALARGDGGVLRKTEDL